MPSTADTKAGAAQGVAEPPRSTERAEEGGGKEVHETQYENLRFEREGSIAVVTLNRPNKRNALSLELMRELLDCLGRIGEERLSSSLRPGKSSAPVTI